MSIRIGHTVVTDTGTWDGPPLSYTYQWEKSPNGTTSWSNITGATASSLLTTLDLDGFYVRCQITATNLAGSSSSLSNSLGPVAAPPPVTIGNLGCGSYEVYILTRGGGQVVASVPTVNLKWQRRLDDTSEANINGVRAECNEVLDIARPWRHEIAIYRDGEQVWVGPFYSATTPVDGEQIDLRMTGRDLSAWWDRRRIHYDHNFSSPTDLAVIFQALVEDAMNPDNSPNITVDATPCGVTGVRQYLASQHKMAGPEIRSISKIGIDWTMVGRESMVGGLVVPTTPIALLIDQHFLTPPTINLDGSEQVNTWTLVGQGTTDAGGDAIFGTYQDPSGSTLDGLLENVAVDQTILDDESAQAGAQSRTQLTTTVNSVEQAYLAPSAPVTIAELIPGSLCDLDLKYTSPPFRGRCRLQQIDVTASNEEGTPTEVVSLTFQPEGTT